MAMNLGSSNRPLSEINVTPMVDVVLVLLIIFMVAAPMIQQGVAVELPRAKAAALESKEEHVVLSVTRERRIFFGEVEIPKDQLVERLRGNLRLQQDQHVFIHADRSLEYGFVVDVMSALSSAGIVNVGMVTDPTADNTRAP